MTIEHFAEKYHARTRTEDGETFIPGTQWDAEHSTTNGHQVYEYGDGRLALLLMFPVDAEAHEIGGSGKSAKWVHARKKLIEAGLTIKQNGDAEGVALFNPEDKAQAKLALKMAGVRTRQLSPERKAALATQLAAARAKKSTESSTESITNT
jgi:hypothetical protein